MELTYQSLRARALSVAGRASLKCLALCLACVACVLPLAASAAKAAPAAVAGAVQAQQFAAKESATKESATKESAAKEAVVQESAASGSPVEVRELWTGSLYSSTYRVGVCFSAQGTVRGVVQLRLYNGKVDVYHIDGTVLNNDIEAHHSSGHKFKGRLVSADTVEGVISLKNGMNVRLEGKRTHGVDLAPEDCAPLPQ